MGPSSLHFAPGPSIPPSLFLVLPLRVVAVACLSTHRHPKALIKDNSCNGVISDDRRVLEAELLISIWKSTSLSPLRFASVPLARACLCHSRARVVKLDARGARANEGDWTRRAKGENERNTRTRVERSAGRCAARARKGVANRSENTEPEIAAQPARRVPTLEPIERSSPISEFQIRACRVCVAGISH